MTENTTITAAANNIYSLYGFNATYSTAHSTYYGTRTAIYMSLGQLKFGGGEYGIYRGTLLWSLSALSGYTITAATIKLTGYNDVSSTDFDLHAYSFTESSLSENTTCYNAYGSTSFGSWASSGYVDETSDANTITINASGISYLNDKVGGNCVIMLRSSRDVSETTPSGSEYVIFYSASYGTAAKQPHLYLEYSEASTWTPKIMMIMKPLADGFLDWIRKPLQQDMYLQI